METTADIDERKKCDSCYRTIRYAQELLVSAHALARVPSFAAHAAASIELKALVNDTEIILRLLELGSTERTGTIMTWGRTTGFMEAIRTLSTICLNEDEQTSKALGCVVELAKGVAYHFIDYTYLKVELEFDIGLDVLPGFLDEWLRQVPNPYLQLCAQTNEIVTLANSAHARQLATEHEDWEVLRSAVSDCAVDLDSFVAEHLNQSESPELVRMRELYDIQVPSFVFILAYGRHLRSKVEDLPSEKADEICCWLC